MIVTTAKLTRATYYVNILWWQVYKPGSAMKRCMYALQIKPNCAI